MTTATTEKITWCKNEHSQNLEARHNDLVLCLYQYNCPGERYHEEWLWEVRHQYRIRVSAIVPTLEEAREMAEHWAEKGLEAVTQECIRDRMDDVGRAVEQLALVSPLAAKTLIGYQEGYKAGLAAAKAAIDNIEATGD